VRRPASCSQASAVRSPQRRYHPRTSSICWRRWRNLGSWQCNRADEQGRVRVDALSEALDAFDSGTPLIVCLQAGNVHSGAFDPLEAAIEVAHQHGAWVHIDGAFGLWAAAAPSLRHLTTGLAGADSWTTDAHKTLNVPYDCGIAIVADPVAMRSTFGAHASYLIADDSGPGDPMEKVPEFSRRARGVPVWAALRSLGRSGVADLVEGLVRNAQALARGSPPSTGYRWSTTSCTRRYACALATMRAPAR
jgi:glutamate/tyrosine decarboxylase-like PLP-dependent enzyme